MNKSIPVLNDKDTNAVSHLLEICNERISGYTTAASIIHDMELKELFHQVALQTEGFIKQLLDFIKEKRDMHLGTRKLSEVWEAWMSLKSTLTNGSRKGIIEACMTGEESAIRNFKNSLEENISAELRQLLSSHLEQIENTYLNIKAIKKSLG